MKIDYVCNDNELRLHIDEVRPVNVTANGIHCPNAPGDLSLAGVAFTVEPPRSRPCIDTKQGVCGCCHTRLITQKVEEAIRRRICSENARVAADERSGLFYSFYVRTRTAV